jgi:uncharacterized protein (TIGR03435 family)
VGRKLLGETERVLKNYSFHQQPAGLPDLFTAIRNAGLEIVSGKGPVDVLVVDRVQKPSEN